jgi:hypothetical protein
MQISRPKYKKGSLHNPCNGCAVRFVSGWCLLHTRWRDRPCRDRPADRGRGDA